MLHVIPRESIEQLCLLGGVSSVDCSQITITPHDVTFVLYVKDEEGKRNLDVDGDDTWARTTTVTVPLGTAPMTTIDLDALGIR